MALARAVYWIALLTACIGVSGLCTSIAAIFIEPSSLSQFLVLPSVPVEPCSHRITAAQNYIFTYIPLIYVCTLTFEPRSRELVGEPIAIQLLNYVPPRIPVAGGIIERIDLGRCMALGWGARALGIVCVEAEHIAFVRPVVRCRLSAMGLGLTIAVSSLMTVLGIAIARRLRCMESVFGLHWIALAQSAVLTMIAGTPPRILKPVVSGVQTSFFGSQLAPFNPWSGGALTVALVVDSACIAVAYTAVSRRLKDLAYAWGLRSFRGALFVLVYPLSTTFIAALGQVVGVSMWYPNLLMQVIGFEFLLTTMVCIAAVAPLVCSINALILYATRNLAATCIAGAIAALCVGLSIAPSVLRYLTNEPLTRLIANSVAEPVGLYTALMGVALAIISYAVSRFRDV